MQLKLYAAIILAISACASGGELRMPTPNIRDALLQAQNAFEINPNQRNIECFFIYSDGLQTCATKYQEDLTTCDAVSKTDLTELENSKVNERLTVRASADSGCSLYSECNEKVLALEFFQCYLNVSKESSAHFSSTKINADSTAQETKQRQNAIAYEKDRCDIKSNDIYLRKSDDIYNDLQKCLQSSVLQ